MLTTIPYDGCFQNGIFYSVGETISSGQSGNWCYGSICGQSGHILQWDNFNCGPTTITTYPPTTSPPSTTPTTQEPIGCSLNDNFYEPGTEIERSEDKDQNWCYGILCSDSGEILYWDDFNCFTTALPPTTTGSTPSITTAGSTPSITTTGSTPSITTTGSTTSITTTASVEAMSSSKNILLNFLKNLKKMMNH